jgi:hypothetical protein
MKRPRPLLLTSAAVVALAAALVGWPGFDGSGAETLRYRTTWNTERLTWHADGGWSVETDLGYRVRIDRGRLVTHSIELVACTDVEAAADAPRRSPLTLLRPRVAFAGHGEPNNPTKVVVARGEDLSRPETTELGQVELDGLSLAESYCEGFLLAAAATLDAASGSSEPVGASLVLEGSWRAPGSDEDQPLLLRSELAWGGAGALAVEPPRRVSLASLTERGALGSWRPALSSAQAQVTLERDLGALFDGLDLASSDPETQARAVLRALAEHQRWSIDG